MYPKENKNRLQVNVEGRKIVEISTFLTFCQCPQYVKKMVIISLMWGK
jgi:hypothetical protein